MATKLTAIALLDLPNEDAFLLEKTVYVKEIKQTIVVTALILRKTPTECVLLRGNHKYVLKARPIITEVAA